jgi:hypothetical protein
MKTCLIFESEKAPLAATGVAVGLGAGAGGAVEPAFGEGLALAVAVAPGGAVVLPAGAVGTPAIGPGVVPMVELPPHPARAAAKSAAADAMETRRKNMKSSGKRMADETARRRHSRGWRRRARAHPLTPLVRLSIKLS